MQAHLKKLKDLKGNEKNLELLCKVLSVAKRTILVNNEERTIFSGLVADDTAALPFTAWQDFSLRENEIIKAENAYTSLWREIVQINFGDNTVVTKAESNFSKDLAQKYKIKDLTKNLSNITVIGKVLALKSKEVIARGEKKNTFTGTLADETGRIQFTAWEDFKLKENDIIKITNAYIKVSKGLPRLNFDARAKVEKLSLEIETPEIEITLEELEARGGFDVVLEGFLLELKPTSGIIVRCTQCRRVLQKGYCALHGKTEGVVDLRIKAVLDDGTGTVNVLFGKELTEKLLGKNLEECKLLANTEEGLNTILEKLAEILLAKPIRLKGYSLRTNAGTIFIITEISEFRKNILEEAKILLEKLCS